MWMVVGLGNPGTRYERTRHNVGFRVVDELVRRHALAWKGGKLGGDAASGVVTTPRGRIKAVLLKPMEFMNLSGHAVQRAAKFHDASVEELVVVHDEIDLDFGVLRLKRGGGHGGHNGLRSIMEQLGKADFLRVRVGVGKPGPAGARPDPDKDVSGWVLSDFPAAQASEVEQLVSRAADSVEAILGLGMTAAMNQFNAKATPKSGAAAAGKPTAT